MDETASIARCDLYILITFFPIFHAYLSGSAAELLAYALNEELTAYFKYSSKDGRDIFALRRTPETKLGFTMVFTRTTCLCAETRHRGTRPGLINRMGLSYRKGDNIESDLAEMFYDELWVFHEAEGRFRPQHICNKTFLNNFYDCSGWILHPTWDECEPDQRIRYL